MDIPKVLKAASIRQSLGSGKQVDLDKEFDAHDISAEQFAWFCYLLAEEQTRDLAGWIGERLGRRTLQELNVIEDWIRWEVAFETEASEREGLLFMAEREIRFADSPR